MSVSFASPQAKCNHDGPGMDGWCTNYMEGKCRYGHTTSYQRAVDFYAGGRCAADSKDLIESHPNSFE